MLPRPTSTGSSIHINPRFRNVHINPHFISKSNIDAGNDVQMSAHTHPPNIHINPKFINSQIVPKPQTSLVNTTVDRLGAQLCDTRNSIATRTIEDHGGGASCSDAAGVNNYTMFANVEPLADTKIHSRTKIRKVPATSTTFDSVAASATSSKAPVASTKSLIRIGSKKLLRVNNVKKQTNILPNVTLTAAKKVIRAVQTKYRIVKEQSAFRIDRRTQLAKQKALLARKTSKVNSIRKLKINESLVPQITVKRFAIFFPYHFTMKLLEVEEK